MVTALLLAALTGCGEGGGEPAANVATQPPAGSEAAPAGRDTITGTFDGDAQLEGGCAWVDDGTTRWNVAYPEGYELTLDPPTLRGPDGLEVKAGDTITVTGTEQTDAMTTCQIGPVWQAALVTVDE